MFLPPYTEWTSNHIENYFYDINFKPISNDEQALVNEQIKFITNSVYDTLIDTIFRFYTLILRFILRLRFPADVEIEILSLCLIVTSSVL